ncbi:MAG: serine protease [Candidatus Latescibacteria bacterium]|nr:serine protease [Candidatus Latescibacterota bacterium]
MLVLIPTQGQSQEHSLLRAIEKEIGSIFETNRQGVVRIHALFTPNQNTSATGSVFTHGSGFIFDSRGYILTIEAAVHGAEEIRVTLASDRQVRARFVGSDPISGVAVIQADIDSLSIVKIGDSDRIQFGHYAFILGNDFGNLVPAFGTMHEIYQGEDLIQVSARVQSSYGGAPVFCSDGRVGGMVWRYQDAPAGYTPSEQLAHTFMGVPGMPNSVFVIPINRAMHVAQVLVSDGKMLYGWLGVEVGMQGEDVVVIDVAAQSPAALSGVLSGDVLLAFGDRAVAGPHHLRRLVMESVPGQEIVLGVRRNGRVLAQGVQLGNMPGQPMVASQVEEPEPEDEMIYRQMDHLQKEMIRLQQLLHQQEP